jgi:hypothetical protein
MSPPIESLAPLLIDRMATILNRLEKLEELFGTTPGEQHAAKIKDAMKRMLTDQNLYEAACRVNRMMFPADPAAKVDEKEFAAACAELQDVLGWTVE